MVTIPETVQVTGHRRVTTLMAGTDHQQAGTGLHQAVRGTAGKGQKHFSIVKTRVFLYWLG